MATEHDTGFDREENLRTRTSLENARADDFHEKFNEDSDLPGVNRKKTTSKLITSVGYLTLLVLALIAVWIVNKPSTAVKEKPSDTKVANRLPAFEVPALTEPPPRTSRRQVARREGGSDGSRFHAPAQGQRGGGWRR